MLWLDLSTRPQIELAVSALETLASNPACSGAKITFDTRIDLKPMNTLLSCRSFKRFKICNKPSVIGTDPYFGGIRDHQILCSCAEA